MPDGFLLKIEEYTAVFLEFLKKLWYAKKLFW